VREVFSKLPDGQQAVTELLISELVTNAVCHARTTAGQVTEVTVRVTGCSELVRVEVYDQDPDPLPPTPLLPAGLDDLREGGMGLRLVAELATAWGSKLVGPGKMVWFEVGRADRPDLASQALVSAQGSNAPHAR
jgi:hypothetical protein